MEQECRNHRDRTPLLETSSTAKAGPCALTLDVELYQSYLDNSDLSADERSAYLEAIWQVIVGFLDFGFAVEPLEKSCGQSSKLKSHAEDPDSALLNSIQHEFNELQKEKAAK